MSTQPIEMSEVLRTSGVITEVRDQKIVMKFSDRNELPKRGVVFVAPDGVYTVTYVNPIDGIAKAMLGCLSIE